MNVSVTWTSEMCPWNTRLHWVWLSGLMVFVCSHTNNSRFGFFGALPKTVAHSVKECWKQNCKRSWVRFPAEPYFFASITIITFIRREKEDEAEGGTIQGLGHDGPV